MRASRRHNFGRGTFDIDPTNRPKTPHPDATFLKTTRDTIPRYLGLPTHRYGSHRTPHLRTYTKGSPPRLVKIVWIHCGAPFYRSAQPSRRPREDIVLVEAWPTRVPLKHSHFDTSNFYEACTGAAGIEVCLFQGMHVYARGPRIINLNRPRYPLIACP